MARTKKQERRAQLIIDTFADAFAAALRAHPPALAEVRGVVQTLLRIRGDRDFAIAPSRTTSGSSVSRARSCSPCAARHSARYIVTPTNATMSGRTTSIFFSRIASGSAPVISTWAWNSLMSNLSPSSPSAFLRSRWMVSAPSL